MFFPDTQLLSPSKFVCLWMTGDWGPIGSFRMGTWCQKDHGVIRKWELSAPPLTSGDREELELELITDHAYVMKPPSALLKRDWELLDWGPCPHAGRMKDSHSTGTGAPGLRTFLTSSSLPVHLTLHLYSLFYVFLARLVVQSCPILLIPHGP